MKFKVALIQSKVSMDKQKNIENAVDFIKLVSNEGADLAVFPEMFNCPYDTSYFREYGEEEGGYCFEKMREAAREAGIYVVAGSMPNWTEIMFTTHPTCLTGREKRLPSTGKCTYLILM